MPHKGALQMNAASFSTKAMNCFWGEVARPIPVGASPAGRGREQAMVSGELEGPAVGTLGRG